jgi:hypothetical protein
MVELDSASRFVTHGGGAVFCCPGSGHKKLVKGFMDGYKTYDPSKEGYGSSLDWTDQFHARMGFEEAEKIIHGQSDTPRGILGVGASATWAEIKKAYRAMAQACHPDLCSQHGLTVEAATEAFKRISAAYVVLEREFGV